MRLDILKAIPWKSLEEKVRQVPLLNSKKSDGSQVFVYRNAHISLRNVRMDEVNPTSFYALKSQLQIQRDLREALLDQYNIDTLALNSLLVLKTENGEEFGLMPPVVEVQTRRVKYVPKEGEIIYDDSIDIKVAVINDGLHRFMLAGEFVSPVNVVYIVGADPEFPFYAHPNEWRRVKLVDAVPKTKQEKKLYLKEDCYELYRNFGILGCGAPRGTGK